MTRPKRPNIIDQLRAHVEAHEASENAVAKGAKVDQANLNHFLLGQRGISLATFAKLCEYLDLELVRK